MTDDRRCPRCEAVLPADAPEGLCAGCLLQAGLEAERRLRIRCPNCRVPVELVDEAPLAAITCPSCQSRFSVVGDATLPGDAERPVQLGQFELVERIGVGAFGTVWKARDGELDRTVAVKVPRKGGLSPLEAEAFVREARAAAQLKHPHIVGVHEVGREGGTLYIVSDYVPGVSLAAWLSGRRPTPREAAELCATIAAALQHAHEAGIVHRDLKPSNIVLDGEGAPHLTDFGLAKREAAEITMTLEGKVLGTPAYMSPEQARGEGHTADARSDVYSLGVILFELLTGEPPFRGTTQMLLHQVLYDEPPGPRRLNGNVPRDLETICLKCLEKEPRRRYQSAAELAGELRRFLADEPIRARPVGRIERGWRWARRQPLLASLGAALAVSLLVGTVVSTYFGVVAGDRARREAGQRRRAEDREQQWIEATRRAEKERDAKNAALERSESLRLVAHSSATLPENPGLALVLAAEAARVSPGRGAEHNNALVAALDVCHERRTLVGTGPLPLGQLQDGSGFVSVQFSADGSRLAAVADCRYRSGEWRDAMDRHLYVFDVATGRTVARLGVPERLFNCVAFSPDGKRLAATVIGATLLKYADGSHCQYSERAVRIWNLDTGEDTHVLCGHTDRVVSAEFSPDGRRLLTASWDRTARVWDLESGDVVHTFEEDEALTLARFNADGNRAFTLSSGGDFSSGDDFEGQGLKLPQYEDNPPLRADAPEKAVMSGWGTQGGRRRNSLVRLWDTASGRLIATIGDTQRRYRFQSDSGLLDAERRKQLQEPNGPPVRPANDTTCAAFSPDGARLLTGIVAGVLADGKFQSRWQVIDVWDAADGSNVTWVHPSADADAHEVVDGDRRLLIRPAPPMMAVWQAQAAEEVSNRSWRSVPPMSPLAKPYLDGKPQPGFSRDAGPPLAAVPRGNVVSVRQLPDGQPIAELKGHTDKVMHAAIAPDGRMVATAAQDGTVRLWDLRPAGYAATLDAARQTIGNVSLAAFSADRRRVALVSGQKFCVLDLEAGTPPQAIDVHRDFDYPAFRAQLKAKPTLDDEEALEKSIRDALRSIIDIQFSPDGRRVVTVTDDYYLLDVGAQREPSRWFRPVKVWDAEKGELLYALEGFQRGVNTARFSPDGRWLLTFADGRNSEYSLKDFSSESGGNGAMPRVDLWDAATGEHLRAVVAEPAGELRYTRIEGGGEFALWVPGGRMLTRYSGRNYPSSDDDGEDDFRPHLWDAAGAGPPRVLRWDNGPVHVAVFSRDGACVFGFRSDYDKQKPAFAAIWDAASGKLLAECDGHTGDVTSAQFSPDGRLVATTSADRSVRIWDAATGNQLHLLAGHEERVDLARFSPDGRWLLTVGGDTARLWSTATWSAWLTLAQPAPVRAAEFSADSRRVLVACGDGSLRIAPVDPLSTAQHRKPRELTPEERSRFAVPQ